jgi:hypothetical protein
VKKSFEGAGRALASVDIQPDGSLERHIGFAVLMIEAGKKIELGVASDFRMRSGADE